MRAHTKEPSKLRIAMISTPFVPVPPAQYGGTELVVGELIDGLIEQKATVTLFATGDSVGGFKYNTKVKSTFATASWPPSTFSELEHTSFALRELLADQDSFDVVHSHCPTFLHLAPLLKIPVVYTLHHAFKPAFSRLYRSHPEVTYVSISQRQQELAGPFQRSAVIHHGLNPERYALGNCQYDTLAFLGRLSEVKAPHLAIDAAKLAGLRIRIAGRPHPGDRQYFQSEVAPRLEQKHVDYLNQLSHEPKVELLSSSRALLFPIGWEEPFGLVAVEAMLCGCPVIAFARGSAPELIDEGITGFVAKDFEQMVKLVREKTGQDFDRKKCREHAAARFNAKNMAMRYMRVYRAACATALPLANHQSGDFRAHATLTPSSTANNESTL